MAEHQHQHQHEFLPLCDVLFNIISLASYFCDVVFDLAMTYALAYHPATPSALFPLSAVLVVTSLLVSQIVSIKWYFWGARGKLQNNSNSGCDINGEKKTANWTLACVLLLHTTQIGVLWRYFKLFIPVDLTYVKHEVRELCVLRLIHAFCEAAPMLLLQVYLLAIGLGGSVGIPSELELEGSVRPTKSGDTKLAELTAVSAGLSLWSVCWAVASFSKGAARLRNLERLVLTWLGVLAQLAWRLGTVSARVGALVAYASVYGGQWLLVVMALHWLSMLTWLLLTPDGLFHGGEKLPLVRKVFIASLLAFIYVFSYVNLHETNHRQKMVIFYSVMFLENSLLMGVWAVGVSGSDIHHHTRPVTLILILLALFFGGLFFMGLYYRFFHVRRLRYEAGGRMNGTNEITTLSHQNAFQEKQTNGLDNKHHAIGMRKVKLNNGGIPGVFNCRFANPAVTNHNRKKKKPTTFVPPPTQPQANIIPMTTLGDTNKWSNGNVNGPQLIPFWKRPLSISSLNNEDEMTREKNESDLTIGGSLSVNLIHEKLREKKQQQLRELRAIQEEIKEGKLVPPPSASTSSFSSNPSVSNQQPPPNTKLHTSPTSPLSASSNPSMPGQNGSTITAWPPVKMHCLLPPPPSSPYYQSTHPTSPWKRSPKKVVDTPEILLAPRCLPYDYPHWSPPMLANHRLCINQNGLDETSKDESHGGEDMSDIEGSQLSLPRSYTLPREFKYHNKNNDRRERGSRFISSRFYLPSTNSSDGDVDSADNEEETDSELQIRAKPEGSQGWRKPYELGEDLQTSLSCGVLRPSHPVRTKVKHETKL
ncbi:PREDICTED: uncharacterized protein LOC105363964 [Ceratosolen solmsi marchali]|uniref:XK-related protein n=1 Tax=Ceratosolen solmsi marchali TaxID=326594 RepID=A0AAJ7DXJ0_9HYME|nr:PREDICTED: uncharacterized protein LOC105363964 [Ceratosolen solmsi marchali]